MRDEIAAGKKKKKKIPAASKAENWTGDVPCNDENDGDCPGGVTGEEPPLKRSRRQANAKDNASAKKAADNGEDVEAAGALAGLNGAPRGGILKDVTNTRRTSDGHI